MLFNALLEKIMRETKGHWRQHTSSMQLDAVDASWLKNLPFADEAMLLARTRLQLQKRSVLRQQTLVCVKCLEGRNPRRSCVEIVIQKIIVMLGSLRK